MSRIRFKGGAWTNSEDEVLRASLTVYGMQNWERVASMLVRKTAAQCRERWENYLDPRLHIREEWTAEEEEQLVQLQSLFANQWNLIALELRHRSGMNRPAWLCEEHYNSLLDALEYERQRKEGRGGTRNDSMTLEDFLQERKRHRAVHQGHETRAARPDAVNSEVFEKEMVEFAVSRMANQDGKKGLRKERKKQLEHTSFLAKLQSNRESIESGTLSAKAKKRMERAMMEDRSGPKDTLLGDKTIQEEDDDNDEDEDEEGEGDLDNRRQGRRGFQPIDLGTDKQAAGIQAKQRVLVKDLSLHQMQRQDNSAASGGVNVKLLRLASGASTTTSVDLRLDGKKDALLLHGSGSSSSNNNNNEKKAGSDTDKVLPSDTTDLDKLFLSLPDVMTTTHGTAKRVEVHDSGLLENLATPTPDSIAAGMGNTATPIFEASETVSDVITTIAPGVAAHETTMSLDFSKPAGRALLRETRRRVSLEAERVFLSCKRPRSTMEEYDLQPNGWDAPENDANDVGMDGENEDQIMRDLVRALVANQLPSAARDLLREVPHGGSQATNTTEHSGDESSNDGEKDEEHEAVVRAKLAVRVGAAQLESGNEFWKDVDVTEATVQLEELVRHQQEHVATVSAKDAAAQKNAARVLSISFLGGMPRLYNDGGTAGSAFRRACAYWGAQLQDAHRQLVFYKAIREKERQEMQHRLDDAMHHLQEIEQKEKMLQELYRSMRLGQGGV